jgi:hypothetical protein
VAAVWRASEPTNTHHSTTQRRARTEGEEHSWLWRSSSEASESESEDTWIVGWVAGRNRFRLLSPGLSVCWLIGYCHHHKENEREVER